MKKQDAIPIVVGVTGHRELRGEDRETLLAAVTRELRALQSQCPNSPLLLLTSLAEGGDQLCADAAAALDIPLAVVLPTEREQYLAGFSEAGRERFETHCARAETVFAAPPSEAAPASPDADFFYRQAGIYVSAHCHALLALWDGGAPSPTGCGTAEAVGFALNGAYRPRSGMAIRSADNAAVIHVMTPRAGAEGEAGAVKLLGNEAAFRRILAKTDEFNRLAAGEAAEGRLLPAHEADDAVLERLERLYFAADAQSVRNAGVFYRILALMAAASTLVTAAFLLYDEAELLWMLIVCGAMLAALWICSRYAKRSDCHRRYIEYRALAESLRVQCFLRYAGSALEAAELFTWTQQTELSWIMAALCALTAGEGPRASHDVRDCWAEAQRSYHQRAGRKTRRDSARGDLVVKTALIVSVALYLAALAFELLCGGLLFPPAVAVAQIDVWRAGLKIVLGSLSAATLFVANYSGKRSLPRQLSDHAKMERFYALASRRLAAQGQTDALLETLAREELIENGNWCSYQSDNTPDVSL